MIQTLSNKLRAQYESHLLRFTQYTFEALHGFPFIINKHHVMIADALAAVERGEIKNLLINMPPRYGKTEIAVVNWIAYSLARNPSAKFIHLSYSADLALDNSQKTRDVVKSAPFQMLWPTGIKSDTDSKAKWYTEQGGGLYATMAGGAVTGFGAGCTVPTGKFDGAIIIDDPLKPDDARSDAEREKVNERLNTTIKSRRNHRNTPIVIIMQRLHQNDMSGFVLGNGIGEEFHHLRLPALQDDDTALWPDKHTVDELKAMQAADSYNFAAQYQQQPVPTGGAVFKTEKFNRYLHVPTSETVLSTVISWDTAYKPQQHNDPSCGLVFYVTPSGYYLVDVIHGRFEYPELRRKVFESCETYKPDAVLIEDKASGQSLIQELHAATQYPVIAIKPDADKETRARVASATVEAGKVFIPQHAIWLAEFEEELAFFPNGRHDDRVDALSQFIRWKNGDGDTGSFNAMMDRLYGK